MTGSGGELHSGLRGFPGILLELDADGSIRDSNGRLEQLLGVPVTGSKLARHLDETSREKLGALLAGSHDPQGRWELVLHRRDTMELRTFVVQRSDAGLWLLEYVRDPEVEVLQEELSSINSDLVNVQRELTRERTRLARALEGEQAARSRAEAATERNTTLLAITEAALEHLDLDRLLESVLSLIADAIDADCATVMLVDANGENLVVTASHGLEEEVHRGIVIPVGEGVRGIIAATAEPIVVADLSTADVVSPVLRERVHSLMGAPLRAGERTIGVVHVGTRERREFTRDDVRFLRLVADRVASAIERTRLYQAERDARRVADAAVRARNDVLGVVSHDLRNPLSTIFTSASLLLELDLPADQQRRQLEIIKRAADRTIRLIGDLLEVTRIEGGGLKLELRPIDVHSLLTEVCDMFQGRVEERGITFHCATPKDMHPVHGDRDRILQVFSNLLGNALKFTPRGGRITVAAREHEAQVQFEVCDTGPGIAAEDMPHLFERFWQAHRAGGAGLGLAIAKAIVEAHGGEIGVRTQPNEGSTFWFTMKQLDTAAGSAVRSPQQEHP